MNEDFSAGVRTPWSLTVSRVIVCLIVALMFVGCSEEQPHSGTPTPATTTTLSTRVVNIAYLPIIPDLPLFVANDERIFQKHGLRPKLVKVAGSGNQVLEALARGDADFAYLAFSTVLEAEAQTPGTFVVLQNNVDAKDFAGLYSLVARDVSATPDVKSFRGKRLATFPGSAMLVLTSLMLRSAGLEPGKDVSISQLAPPAQVAALKTGQVDGLLALEPIGALAEHAKAGRIIDRWPLTPSVAEIIPTGASVVRRDSLATDAALVAALRASMDDAIDFIRAHPAAMAGYYTRYCDVPPEVAAALPVLSYWKSSEVQPEVSQRYADLLLREKSLPRAVNVAGLYPVAP